jgi:hypothetical protein
MPRRGSRTRKRPHILPCKMPAVRVDERPGVILRRELGNQGGGRDISGAAVERKGGLVGHRSTGLKNACWGTSGWRRHSGCDWWWRVWLFELFLLVTSQPLGLHHRFRLRAFFNHSLAAVRPKYLERPDREITSVP